jgi:hypothetical protein
MATIRNFQLLKVEQNLVLDTVIYATGDVLAATAVIDLGAHLPSVPRRGLIAGVTVLDKDDTGAAFDLVFLDGNVALGTVNNPPTITDADAEKILAVIPVGTFVDVGGAQVARPIFDPIPFALHAGASLAIAAISRGTGTYTAAGIRVKLLIRVENVGAIDVD